MPADQYLGPEYLIWDGHRGSAQFRWSSHTLDRAPKVLELQIEQLHYEAGSSRLYHVLEVGAIKWRDLTAAECADIRARLKRMASAGVAALCD